MKIAFVEPHLETYGGIRRIIELSNRLTKRGHDVTIFHPSGTPCTWMECFARVKAFDEIFGERQDVIIYNDPNLSDYKITRNADARLKVFYILELYEKELLKGLNPRIFRFRNWRMLVLKTSLHSPYLKLSNATWIREWIEDNLKIDSELLIGGVNREMFHPVDIKRGSNGMQLLCSGDPRKRKGTGTVLEAVEIAKREEPQLVLNTYHGKGIPQENMAATYSAADVFLDGQWYAGWNNPVAEAMACKVAVICTDIGGVRDFAFHGKTALLVPANNARAMASAIVRLVRNRELRETLRENAYKYIRQFDWDKSAERLEQILDSELSKSSPSHSRQYYGLLDFATKVWWAFATLRYRMVNAINSSSPREDVFRKTEGDARTNSL